MEEFGERRAQTAACITLLRGGEFLRVLTSDFRDALQPGHGQQHNDALVSANPQQALADEQAGDTDVFLS